jgi:hypothetical protein
LYEAVDVVLGYCVLTLRHRQAFAPTWAAASKTAAERDHRTAIDATLQALAAPYKDPHCPDVQLLPLWHGTRPEILPSLFATG